MKLLFAIIASGALTSSFVAAEKQPTAYEKVQTIMNGNCVSCHQGMRSRGGIDLTSYEGMMEGRGLVVPGRPDDSVLVQVLTGANGRRMMPPRGQLSDEQIKQIRTWIKDGAKK